MRKEGDEVLVNVNLLKGKIIEKGLNVSELAAMIGIDKATFYRKLGSDGENFTIKEADLIASNLALNRDEVNAIFFSQFVV